MYLSVPQFSLLVVGWIVSNSIFLDSGFFSLSIYLTGYSRITYIESYSDVIHLMCVLYFDDMFFHKIHSISSDSWSIAIRHPV